VKKVENVIVNCVERALLKYGVKPEFKGAKVGVKRRAVIFNFSCGKLGNFSVIIDEVRRFPLVYGLPDRIAADVQREVRQLIEKLL